MNNKLNFLETHDILATLVKDCFIKKKEDLFLIQEILREVLNINNFDDYHDIIGSIYEKKKYQIERKGLGEFYTPKIIVNYILDSVGLNPKYNLR